MLTRLRVSGFKNLVDVDVRFGPFTCIAGINGVGKSNLFDAIRFLSALADQPLVDAALAVRDEGERTGNIRDLFNRTGETFRDEMSFDVEMIVPTEGTDDLGQEAKATITFLHYGLPLAYRRDDQVRLSDTIELVREELHHINIGNAHEALLFPHSVNWRRSVVHGRRASPFISTEYENNRRVIKVHQDGGSAGRARQLLAANLPRTVLSVADATESPTALLARRELQSWRLLQLEPAAMRQPDSFSAPTQLGADGSHLAATLDYLARLNEQQPDGDADQVYAQAANRLATLIDDVRSVWIDRDERRELLTLFVAGRDKTPYPARALSDGTLRFLALSVLALDPRQRGVICLEEPENGIHPDRIPAILQLLSDIAVDAQHPVDAENPLRQVIINTHSPAVVQQVPEESLLFAEARDIARNGTLLHGVRFAGLPDTWRTKEPDSPIVSLGRLLSYLHPVAAPEASQHNAPKAQASRRVIDRNDIQMLLPFETEP